jgi:flagellar hook-basal body complex protein FliE
MISSLVSSATQQAISRLGEAAASTTSASTASVPAAGESFGAVLGKMVDGVQQSLGNAEALSIKSMTGGNVDTRQVVDAVMSAQQSLQTAIAIRDKIVQAYLDISRMAI